MDRDWNGITFDASEVTSMQTFVDRVRSEFARIKEEEGSAHLFIEHGLGHPEIHELFYGKLDAGVIANSHAKIFDYKHGEGVAVDVEENAQVRYYGAGFVYDRHEILTIEYEIVQPRAFHPLGPVRTWSEPVKELLFWLKHTLVPAMNRADPRHPYPEWREFVLGEHCRFCSATLSCKARQQQLTKLAEGVPSMQSATNAELAELLSKIPHARAVIKAAEAEGLRRMQDGQDIPDFKLVRSKTVRKWKEGAEQVARDCFGTDAYNTELKSPAQMEKVVGAQPLVDEWAYSPEGGLSIAPAGDKRTAIAVKRLSEGYPTP
jgi:hypothetical protein